MGKNTVEAKTCLDKHYGVSAPGKSTICDWYSNFKRGRTSTEDSKRSGRPKEVIIPEIIRQVRQIVLTDRRVKVREIAETVGISTGSAVSILHDHLHMKKLNVKWVPHFLDIEQREKRVADSKSCLDMFNRNPSEYLRRYITMDETWIHPYISESNRSSAEWREAGESRSKRMKASRWAAVNNHFSLILGNLKNGEQSPEVTSALVESYRNRALDVFIRGLNDEISKLLVIRKPKTLPEAYAICLDIQNVTSRTHVPYRFAPAPQMYRSPVGGPRYPWAFHVNQPTPNAQLAPDASDWNNILQSQDNVVKNSNQQIRINTRLFDATHDSLRKLDDVVARVNAIDGDVHVTTVLLHKAMILVNQVNEITRACQLAKTGVVNTNLLDHKEVETLLTETQSLPYQNVV
ncbi:hypothetical protein ACLKA7_001561 [Drosophila subpalustris]